VAFEIYISFAETIGINLLLVDPFTEKLKFNIEIKGGVAQARNHMIKKLVMGDKKMIATNCRSRLLQLNQYCTRQGDQTYVFELDRVGLSLNDVGKQEKSKLLSST
jgi:hypothetical protein